MSEWGNLESQLFLLFHTLIGTKEEISYILFSTGFQTKTLIDILKALGQLQLLDTEQKVLNSLCRRYNKAASKRNKIVHSKWFISADHTNAFNLQWERVYSPIDRDLVIKTRSRANQKTSNYRFTIKQILLACEDIIALARDIMAFGSLIALRLEPPLEDEEF